MKDRCFIFTIYKMAGNAITIAPLISISEPMETIQLTPNAIKNTGIQFATVPSNVNLLTTYNTIGNSIYIQHTEPIIPKPMDFILKAGLPVQLNQKPQPVVQKQNCHLKQAAVPPKLNYKNCNEPENMVVYQVTYPEDLNLRAVKRSRPKSKQQEKLEKVEKTEKQPPQKPQRTRSGRIIKTPKHIEKDFEKIIITNEPEVKTAKFESVKDDEVQDNKNFQELEVHFKKKTYAAQYRCSFCNKVYLGKKSMYHHLLKNPDHGPLPDRNNSFDVWNYLVDITQKCPSGRRGTKFCEELTNLLHNLQLLTGALFKTNNSSKSMVQVDKVLGNAIGIEPGKYYFDENELYKDVTVLKLITNSHCFAPKKPIEPKKEEPKVLDEKQKTENDSSGCAKKLETENRVQSGISSPVSLLNSSILSMLENPTLSESDITKKLDKAPDDLFIDEVRTATMEPLKTSTSEKVLKLNNTFEDSLGTITHMDVSPIGFDIDSNELNKSTTESGAVSVSHHDNTTFSSSNLIESAFHANSDESKDSFVKSNVALKLIDDNACLNSFNKEMEQDGGYKKINDNHLSLQSELLSDNSLLESLPNLRNSVDELMLSNVDTTSNLLDNSTGSDEVMNVDQFVNERFKKITEPYSDVKFNTSLNLELPALDLFQFHTS